MKKLALFITLFFVVIGALLYASSTQIKADGTVAKIGASIDNDGSSDAVSWSNSSPIMIDSYGKWIVPVQLQSDHHYYMAYSNDNGANWNKTDVNPTLTLRPATVYDSRNDKIHAIVEGTSGVTYQRINIKRDQYYNITGFYADPAISGLTMDSQGSCSSATFGTYPVLLWKDDGANGILAAFWSVTKTCSAVTKTENRASMRVLSNSSADAVAGNWTALNGSSDSFGAASVGYNALYSYTGTPANSRAFIQSAMIKGGATAKSNDLYYFNIDENETYGFRRLAWNSGSTNWSGSWTSRTTFAGDVDGSGYANNDELLTKPVLDPNNDRVYIGIGWYRNGTLKDTQTLYYINSSDSVVEAGDVYNHKNGTWFAPTIDLMYNDDDQKVYVFYQTSSTDPTNASNTSSSFEGNAWYRTYDGSSFGTPQAFLSQPISGTTYTVDVPIVYKSPVNGKIILFFRADGSELPYTPPHYFLWGYLSSGGTNLTGTQDVTSPYSATTFSDFDKSCVDYTATQLANTSGGEIELQSFLRDDFETPRSPYARIFYGNWSPNVWSSGTFDPTPSGTVLVYGSGGAYLEGVNTTSNKVLEFRAKFTQHNFQHVGWVNDEFFGKYAMFSTGSDAQLRTRTSDGSETASTHGTSALGSFHKYKIDWGASNVKYYLDDSLIQTTSTNLPSSAMRPFISNNTTTSGSDLTVDWIKTYSYSTTSGTYRSCSLKAADTDTNWGTITYNSTTPTGTSVQVKTRTSNDNSSWTSWSSALTSGDTITSSPGKYLQYQITLNGTSVLTPSLDDLSLTFTAPTPTATPQPTNSSSNSSNTTSSGAAASCSDSAPLNAPNLYAALSQGSDAIQLYFSDTSQNVTTYALEYGTSNSAYSYAADNIGKKGARTYTVKSLLPNTLYYFRIRNANGCMPGSWSNQISARTAASNANSLITNVSSVDQTPSEKPLSSPTASTDGSPQATTSPQVRGYEVKIQVKDKQQQPVQNAKVTLHSTPMTAYTDARGFASFSNVEKGEHTVQVAYNDYQGEQKLTLEGDVKEFNINIQIEKKENPWGLIQGISIGILLLIVCILIILRWRNRQ